MSLTAITAPRFICSPKVASPPVIGPAVATTTSCALADAVKTPAANAAIANPLSLCIVFHSLVMIEPPERALAYG